MKYVIVDEINQKSLIIVKKHLSKLVALQNKVIPRYSESEP